MQELTKSPSTIIFRELPESIPTTDQESGSELRISQAGEAVVTINLSDFLANIHFVRAHLDLLDQPIQISTKDYDQIRAKLDSDNESLKILDHRQDHVLVTGNRDVLGLILDEVPDLGSAYERDLSSEYSTLPRRYVALEKSSKLGQEELLELMNRSKSLIDSLLQTDDPQRREKIKTILRSSLIRHEYDHVEQYLQFFVEDNDFPMDLPSMWETVTQLCDESPDGELWDTEAYESLATTTKQVSTLCEMRSTIQEFGRETTGEVQPELVWVRIADFLGQFVSTEIDFFPVSNFEGKLQQISQNGYLDDDHQMAVLLLLTKDLGMIEDWQQDQEYSIKEIGPVVLERMRQALNSPEDFFASFDVDFKSRLDILMKQKVAELKSKFQEFTRSNTMRTSNG